MEQESVVNDSVECFVCMEVAPRCELLKTCRCDRFVHRKCFERLVSEVDAHATRCPICTEVYPMCTVGHTHRLGFRVPGVVLICSYGTLVGAGCFFISAFSMPPLMQMMLMLVVAIGLTGVISFLFAPLMRRILARYCCFMERRAILIPRVLASSSYRVRRIFATLSAEEVSLTLGIPHVPDADPYLSV